MPDSLDPAVATVVSALIAAFVASTVAAVWQLYSERQRWRRERELEDRKIKIDLIGETNKILAQGFHEAIWLTWHARNISELIDEKSFETYDIRMKLLYPDMTSVISRLAYVGEDQLSKFEKQMNDLWCLYRKITSIGTRYIKANRDRAIANLAHLHDTEVAPAFERFTAFVWQRSTSEQLRLRSDHLGPNAIAPQV